MTPTPHSPEPGSQPENVVLIHWHDLGRHLGCYGQETVASPRVDALAAQGVRLTNAHATAPLCSPARASLFTGRYPHSVGMDGLAHHGFGYRDGVRTLPAVLGAAGWDTALFGMQHESRDPKSLGFAEVDVTDSRCGYVSQKATEWLRERQARQEHATPGAGAARPFFLTAGFFETHRPYPVEEYAPADPQELSVPEFLPDSAQVREDLAGLHGSIAVADAAVGRILDTLDQLDLRRNTWVIFTTDHGLAFPRAKSTLYGEGTGIALIVRPPADREVAPFVYADLFSGVDLTPTLLELLGREVPAEVEGESHAEVFVGAAAAAAPASPPIREEVFTEKTYHDTFDPIRAIRTPEFSYIENFTEAKALVLPLDIADSLSARSLDAAQVDAPRPRRELYDLTVDPTERHNVIDDPAYQWARKSLETRLRNWRRRTRDFLPKAEDGRAIANHFMEAFFASRSVTTRAGEEQLPSRRPRGERRELEPEESEGRRSNAV